MVRRISAVVLAGLWITFSEFLRNEILFKGYWVTHFASLGLTFQTLPLNGILWMVWSFVLAGILYTLVEKFSLRETIILGWVLAFVLMWISLYNLQVLPIGLLIVAVPLSGIEIIVAALIIAKILQK